MFSFQHPEYLAALILIIPVVALYYYVVKWKNKVKGRIGDAELVDRLTNEYSAKNFRSKFLIFILAFILCILAAANLRSPKEGVEGKRSGVDVMVALDVSNSMLAQDVKPNRLERAKQILNQIITDLGNNRMGMVVFAGQAFLQMPLTTDLSAAKMYVSNANPDAVPRQGTVIGDALRLCSASLETREKKYKTIILISDGEDHDKDLGSVIEELVEAGVVVHTIGIGSPDGAPIFDPVINDYKKDENGNVVVSKLNQEDLVNLASKTGGEFLLFTASGNVADQITASINQMEKKLIKGAGARQYVTFYQWFLLLALALIVLEIVIPERKMKWFKWKLKH